LSTSTTDRSWTSADATPSEPVSVDDIDAREIADAFDHGAERNGVRADADATVADAHVDGRLCLGTARQEQKPDEERNTRC
jgi:hypothetical protein